MAWMTVTGKCYCCPRIFSFNAEKVPSFQGEPICLSCITIANAKRAENGLPQWPVADDAYEPQEVC